MLQTMLQQCSVECNIRPRQPRVYWAPTARRCTQLTPELAAARLFFAHVGRMVNFKWLEWMKYAKHRLIDLVPICYIQ